jgi:hypothetical protein
VEASEMSVESAFSAGPEIGALEEVETSQCDCRRGWAVNLFKIAQVRLPRKGAW